MSRHPQRPKPSTEKTRPWWAAERRRVRQCPTRTSVMVGARRNAWGGAAEHVRQMSGQPALDRQRTGLVGLQIDGRAARSRVKSRKSPEKRPKSLKNYGIWSFCYGSRPFCPRKLWSEAILPRPSYGTRSFCWRKLWSEAILLRADSDFQIGARGRGRRGLTRR